MPYIITKKNGKPYKWDRMRPLLSQSDVHDFAHDGARLGDCWTFTSPVTRRSIHAGACKNPTPSNLWGARRRRGRGLRDGEPAKPAAPAPAAAAPVVKQISGWWPFGKKKVVVAPKRRAGDRTIMWVPGPGKGTPMTKRGHGISGARRRRKRRR